jgi:hypothetical protein
MSQSCTTGKSNLRLTCNRDNAFLPDVGVSWLVARGRLRSSVVAIAVKGMVDPSGDDGSRAGFNAPVSSISSVPA